MCIFLCTSIHTCTYAHTQTHSTNAQYHSRPHCLAFFLLDGEFEHSLHFTFVAREEQQVKRQVVPALLVQPLQIHSQNLMDV